MALIQNDLQFPVIHQFSIDQYQLYPGQNGKGFSYTLKPGVNIVVGVNGLGKTTLLNMLMKMVTGPKQIQALTGLGMGNREETPANTRFFSSRVSDAAASASATATLGFGKKRLTVTRKLSNLDITYLKVDEITVKAATSSEFEDHFKRGVLELSGLKQFYDYLLLVHFVFFFLEDRQALIWDEDAQSEILRVLYYDPTQHVAYRNFYNQIAQLDSEIRNTQSVVNRHQKKFKAEMLKKADDQTVREVTSLRKTHEELLKAVHATEEKLENLNTTRVQYRDQLENLKVQREAKIGQARAANEEYLHLEFAAAEDEAMYAIASVISERGCIFCGSKEDRAKHAVLAKLKQHHCPLCDADAKEREAPNSTLSTEPLLVEAQRLELEVAITNDDVTKVQELLTTASKNYEVCMQTLVGLRTQHEEIRLQLRILEQGLPSGSEELKALQEKLLGVQSIIDHSSEEKANAESALESIIQAGEIKVSQVADAIIKRFQNYITGFMAETCVLQYEVREKRIGQGPATVKFRFPSFSVRLTSGVFKDQASNRYNPSDVSESQREFIDLAFRMSLIAEITQRSPAMLVVETPEASLDSVFVPRAGNMVRQFLEVSKAQPNYLVASTNLNREAMIPALFGVIQESEAIQLAHALDKTAFDQRTQLATPKPERTARMVNLLEIAAKNAALLKYSVEYKEEFERAVYPPWEDFNVAKNYETVKGQPT